MLQNVFGWLDDEYDKIPVERVILGDPDLPGTVLRLPMIYGPGDRLSRLHPLRKRMDDRRPVILFEKGWAEWRSPRGYVENVAAALALAAVSSQAAGSVYNVAETPAFSELDWARRIAATTGWNGKFVILSKELLPPHLAQAGNSVQHWEADSTRIRQELGYRELVVVDEAIRRTMEWDRRHPPAGPTAPILDYPAEDAAIAAAIGSREATSLPM